MGPPATDPTSSKNMAVGSLHQNTDWLTYLEGRWLHDVRPNRLMPLCLHWGGLGGQCSIVGIYGSPMERLGF